MGYQNSRFFLADLPRRVDDEQQEEEEGRSLTLSVDFRFWKERWRTWLLLQVKASGVLETVGLGVGGLKWKVSAGREEEDVRLWMETLEERERAKIVLVVVPPRVQAT